MTWATQVRWILVFRYQHDCFLTSVHCTNNSFADLLTVFFTARIDFERLLWHKCFGPIVGERVSPYLLEICYSQLYNLPSPPSRKKISWTIMDIGEAVVIFYIVFSQGLTVHEVWIVGTRVKTLLGIDKLLWKAEYFPLFLYQDFESIGMTESHLD